MSIDIKGLVPRKWMKADAQDFSKASNEDKKVYYQYVAAANYGADVYTSEKVNATPLDIALYQATTNELKSFNKKLILNISPDLKDDVKIVKSLLAAGADCKKQMPGHLVADMMLVPYSVPNPDDHSLFFPNRINKDFIDAKIKLEKIRPMDYAKTYLGTEINNLIKHENSKGIKKMLEKMEVGKGRVEYSKT